MISTYIVFLGTHNTTGRKYCVNFRTHEQGNVSYKVVGTVGREQGRLILKEKTCAKYYFCLHVRHPHLTCLRRKMLKNRCFRAWSSLPRKQKTQRNEVKGVQHKTST